MPGPFQLVTVVPSASVTTQGTGTPVDCTGWQGLSVTLAVTSGSPVAGSISSFRVWLQGNIPPSPVWFDIHQPFAEKSFGVLGTAAVITQSGGLTQALCITSEAASQSSTIISWHTKINSPPPYVRAAWNLIAVTGTPFIQFQVDGVLFQSVSI